MEKSSEKVIGSNKISPNPFNNLLSEVQIKINQPKSTKQIDNYALEIDSKIDKSNSNYVSQSNHQSNKDGHSSTQSKVIHQNVYVINAPLKTKHSSDTGSKQKSEKDIINEWIIGFMAKRHLLGLHWEENLNQKSQQLIKIAFHKIRSANKWSSVECNSYSQRIIRLINVYESFERVKVVECFRVLKDFYKDDLLFGLSNTLGEEREHSLMLKMESDCQSLSLQSKNFRKQGQRIAHQYSFSQSQSNKNLTKKDGSSGSASEDLSNLILNHNKLRLQDDLNRSVPNIPKNKASQRSIKTNKQIGELSIQTKKQISTQKRLAEDVKYDGLPLQSNNNLIHTKKQFASDQQGKPKDQGQEEKTPVTITFILNDINPVSLMKPNIVEIPQAQSKAQPIKITQRTIPQSNCLDLNGINGLPFTESFYQNAVVKPTPLQPKNIDHQKRSTSLQIRPGYEPLFPQKHQEATRDSFKRPIFLNQYYPEQSCRENIRLSKEGTALVIGMGERVRPKSATPKITFTFTSNNTGLSNLKSPTQSKVTNQPSNVFTPFDHHDYIVQSVLHAHSNGARPVVGGQRHKNRLQVVSPSRNGECSKKWMAPNKLAFDNREHIRNNLLPPLSFSDYYGAQNGQKELQSQKSGVQVVFAENQVIYSEHIKKTTTNHSLLGCSPRESALHQPKQTIRMKSPKDKIFVTYANPCQF